MFKNIVLANFIFCMFLTYPIGFLNYYIDKPSMRMLYGFFSGVILQYQMYRFGIIHIFISTIFSYVFIKFLGRKVSSFFIVLFNILYLSFLHIKRMYGPNSWTMEIDSLYMMSICKFSSLAFAFEDGNKKDEDIKNSYWRSKKIIEKPTLLQTFSYVFYFPSSIIGPSFEFSDFLNFIYRRNEYFQIPKMRCIKEAMKQLLIALICMVSFTVFKDKLDFFWVISDEFAEKGLIYKFIYYMVSAGLVIRAKYYTGFKLGESSVIFCGLSYSKKKIHTKEVSNNQKIQEEYVDDFSKIESIRIYNFEMEIDPNEKVNYWNRTVHYWLKYQVFFRLINLEHKFFNKNFAFASFIVFIISAVWHGFYPGYYLFFIQLYFIQQIGKLLEDKLDFFKKVKQCNIFIQFICNLISIFVIGSLGFAFCVLNVYKAMKFYKAFYYIPNLFVLIMYIYLKFFFSTKKHQLKHHNPILEGYNTLVANKNGEENGTINKSIENDNKKEKKKDF